MIVQTRDFGVVEAPSEKVIRLTEPILGFEEQRVYLVLDQQRTQPIEWLQSVDDPSLVFPMIDAEAVGLDYSEDLARTDLSDLKARSSSDLRVLLIVVIPEDVSRTRANLRAPMILNESAGLGKQVVFYDSNYPIQFPLIQPAEAPAEALAC